MEGTAHPGPLYTNPISYDIIAEYPLPPLIFDRLKAHLQERLALLFDLLDGELRASIAHYPGVGRIQLISEQGPEEKVEQKKEE